jgi:pimeloyl-ACP methyl ester carboxylesterase
MTNPQRSAPPLAVYQGALPPRPGWFAQAVARRPEVLPFAFQGAKIELLRWGRPDAPGLLLLHGNRAHAHWWAPLAPLLADDFLVAALSWSGMGGSDWRESYSLASLAEEAISAAEVAGLFEAGRPVLVAHSFGGGPAVIAAERCGERLAGLIILDTFYTNAPDKMLVPQASKHKVYASLEDALVRFRLVPPQDCSNHYYLDWIARNGMRELSPDDPNGPGWNWKFDPKFWDNLIWDDRWRAMTGARCPLAFVDGGASRLQDLGGREEVRRAVPAGTHFEQVADAGHHLMLDKPVEVVSAIRRIALQMVTERI